MSISTLNFKVVLPISAFFEATNIVKINRYALKNEEKWETTWKKMKNHK